MFKCLSFFYCTGNLHLQQREDLEDENGDPAEGVSNDDREESFGNGHLFFDVVAIFSGLSACSLDVIKHTCIGEDNDEECHQVKTYGKISYKQV